MRDLVGILTSEENVRMQYELLIMLLLFAIPAVRVRSPKRLALVWGGIACIFLYLHRILLPVIVSGIYLYVLAGLLAVLAAMDIRAFLKPAGWLKERILIYLGPDCVRYILFVAVIWMLQACRINIALDYDSLRYGLRSDVLLTNGGGIRGFFANTGLVNLVYSYPKGFEVLTRPLYFGHTFGYVLSVNLWILLLAELMAGEMTFEITGSRSAGAFAMGMLAIMPGITNMAVTAKSDLITLLCQLVFIYCVMRYMRAQKEQGRTAGNADMGEAGSGAVSKTAGLTGIGLGALILSYSFKPTALLFSSVTGLVCLFFLLHEKCRVRLDSKGLRILIPALLYTGIMTARTFIIAGMPFTSLFTGIFEKLGMQLKYPLRIQQFSLKTEEGAGLVDGIRFYVTRLLGILFCPTGEDMHHVRMAWGGLAFLLMLLVIALLYKGAADRMEELNRLRAIRLQGEDGQENDQPGSAPALRLTALLSLVLGILALLSLYLLYQIDGNYYMLLYALIGILGSALLCGKAAYETSEAGRHMRKTFSGDNQYGLLFLAVVMLYFTAFTGWAGAVGLTPMDPVNRGYYNHEEELPIINPLHWDKNTRVVALAEEPDCYLLRGRVESWVDLDGSGGNVFLTDTILNIFKEYLSFADIDYIYADLHFLQDDSNPRRKRADTLFIYLLEDGAFEEVVLAEGSTHHVFAKIDKERMAVDWQVQLNKTQQARTKQQVEWFAGIGGYEGYEPAQ